jgi:type I restriction enzyme S subunit
METINAITPEATIKLPKGWEMAQLEDVVDILDSRRVPINAKERETRVGKVPYYGATGQVGWIDDHLFDEELVLLGEDGAPFLDSTKQKAYIIRGKSWVNNHAHVLRARNGIPNPYIKYYLDTVDYHNFVTGTTRLKLNQAMMRKIPVPVAPPTQQKLIVAEIEKQFSRLDEAVANLKRVKANLKRYKAAVISMVTSQTWPQRTLETLLAEPLRNGHSAKAAQVERGVPTFTLSAVTKHDFSDRNIKMTNADKGRVKDLWVKDGDIFVERSNTPELVGTAGLYRGQDNRAIFPDLLIRVRVNQEADPRWIEICLQSERVRRYFRSRAQGISGTMPKIDQQTIADATLPLPSLREQKQLVADIDRRLSLALEVEAQIDANLLRAARLRQSVLKEAFSGKLNP